MEIISTLTNMASGLNSSFEKWKSDSDFHRNILIIECKCNLDLIDLLDWQNVNSEFTNELCKQLSTTAFEAVMAHGDKVALSFLFDAVSSKPISRKESRIVSAISKIQTLKKIIVLREKYPGVGNPKIEKRIQNIKKIHLDIINYLTN